MIMKTRYQLFIADVAKEALQYASKYDCPVSIALDDWEGNGPEGGFGLQHNERADVEHHIKLIEFWKTQ